KCIVVFYLRSELLTLQSKRSFHKFVGKFYPILFWKGNIMRIEIAGGAAKLCGERDMDEKLYLVLNTFHKHHDFFSQSCRTGRLSVCSCEHWNIFPILRQHLELLV